MKRLGAAACFSLLVLGAMCSPTDAASSAVSDESSGFLLTANKGSHTLGIVNAQVGTQILEVPESGITGHEVAASLDGRTAYIPIYGNSGVGKPGTDGRTIDVFDLQTRQRTGSINFEHAVRPHCAVFGKDGRLYVTTELDKTVSIIDPKTLKVIGAVPTGQPESHMFVLSHNGRRGYTANVGPGTVSVLDMEARKTVTIVPVAKQVQRISISADDSMVFTTDQTKPQVAVIDTASNKIKTWIALPAVGFGTTTTPDGRWLLATMPSENKIAVIDLHTLKVVHTVDVPGEPQEILVRPDNQLAYVSCNVKHQVAAIRTSDWVVDKLIDCGKDTDGLAWAPGH